MNNEDEFKRFLNSWQNGQNQIVNRANGVSFRCKVVLDTTLLTDLRVNSAITLANINQPTDPVIKLKHLFHLITSSGGKKTSGQLLKAKETLLNNPRASIGNGRLVLRPSQGKNKQQVWCCELGIFTQDYTSLKVTFVQVEAPGNPVEFHALKIRDITVNL